MHVRHLAVVAFASLALVSTARAQSPVLQDLRTNGVTKFRVDSTGAFVAYGFVRDVGNTTGCASQHPTGGGAGTFFFWDPCRGSFRFGRVPTAQTNWDDANMDDFTFAGGNQVTASGYGAFAFGDQVNVSSTVGVGFGSAVTVSGTAGFSSGASNVCSGFACTAIGYTVKAGGQGSVALGSRTTALNDNSVTIGYRGTNNGHIGSIVLAAVQNPVSQTDSVRAQADGEFRVRAPGGVILRTSFASNAAAGVSSNTGCDLPAGSGTFSCSSSRTIKEGFLPVDGESVLTSVAATPVSEWSYIGDPGIRHIGPVAEDFYSSFHLGAGETSIGVGDISGVNFTAIKALEARSAAQLARIDALEAQLAAALKRIEAIEAAAGSR